MRHLHAHPNPPSDPDQALEYLREGNKVGGAGGSLRPAWHRVLVGWLCWGWLAQVPVGVRACVDPPTCLPPHACHAA